MLPMTPILRRQGFPGTTSTEHLEEDWRALDVELSDDLVARADALVNQNTVSGPRYPAPTQAEIDTEEFELN